MRPIAIICILLGTGMVGAVLLALRLELSRGREIAEAVDREALRWIRLGEEARASNEALVQLLRDELSQALDRVQMPEAAVQFSQSERVARTATGQPEGPVTVDGEGNELSLAELQRQTDELLESELARRGIDPSELQAEAAGYSASE